jgi:hypothetical protein
MVKTLSKHVSQVTKHEVIGNMKENIVETCYPYLEKNL